VQIYKEHQTCCVLVGREKESLNPLTVAICTFRSSHSILLILVYTDMLMLCLCSAVAYQGQGGHKPGNLEYLGNSLNLKNSGNSVQPQRKIVRNKIILVRSNICVKQDPYDLGVATLPSECQLK